MSTYWIKWKRASFIPLRKRPSTFDVSARKKQGSRGRASSRSKRRTNKHDSPYNLGFLRRAISPEFFRSANLSGEMVLCTQVMPTGTVTPIQGR